MSRIVSIGECMVEMAPSGADTTYKLGFAGDTLNTAWYLRQLLGPDDQVDYVTAIGTDGVSDQMMTFLAQAGIGTGHIARRADLTVGLYMIQLNAGERSFSYWRGQSAARTLAQDPDALAQALSGADMAYFSGITLAILAPQDRQTLLRSLDEFRRNGGRVVFDTNLRPRLWTSAQDMKDTVMLAAAASDIVLPSHEDEAVWFGDTDPQATIARYSALGTPTIIVKNGADILLAQEHGIVTEHHPHAVQHIVDTTAAGDSFNAAFLAQYLRDTPLADAIDAGAALAAQVIQARGALIPCLN